MLRKIIEHIIDFFVYSANTMYSIKNHSLLQDNNKLKGKYSGKVFILATGSSAGKLDLSCLKDEYTIGVNRFFLHPQYEDLNVDFFTLIEDWSYRKLTGLSWIAEMCFLKSKRSMITFLHSSAFTYINNDKVDYEYRNKKNLFDKKKIHYVVPSGNFSSVDNIQSNIDKPCNIMSGSLYFSIGLAMYLGFNKVYLIGADYASEPIHIGHFYDGLNEIWGRNEMNTSSHPDLYDNMINQHAMIKSYAEKNDTEIFNVIKKGSSSPIFNSISIEEISKELQ